MIGVVLSSVPDLASEAVLRSISSALDADTPFSREVELRAGSSVTERLQAMGDLPVGAAVITPGGEMAPAFLIHVALHSHEEPVTPEGVRSALKNGLRRAEEWGLSSLAVPPLGTGAGNLDAQEVATIMISEISSHLSSQENPKEVTIVTGTPYEQEVFSRAVELSQSAASPTARPPTAAPPREI